MVIESTRNETVKRARALAQRKGRLNRAYTSLKGKSWCAKLWFPVRSLWMLS